MPLSGTKKDTRVFAAIIVKEIPCLSILFQTLSP